MTLHAANLGQGTRSCDALTSCGDAAHGVIDVHAKPRLLHDGDSVGDATKTKIDHVFHELADYSSCYVPRET